MAGGVAEWLSVSPTRNSERIDFVRSRWLPTAVGLLVLVGLAELAARAFLGLGDPVLYVADPQVEYMLRPDQDVTRLGHRIVVNRYGMRSRPMAEHKSDERELRILVMGDSVVNGGNRIDHSELATTRLEQQLERALGRPVQVGNVSAGSWGPANLLAWTRQFGFLDADAIVLVLSSHDASDVPTFAPLDPVAQPVTKPLSALVEGASNYLPKLLSLSRPGMSTEDQSHTRPPDEAALQAFRQLVQGALATGACVSLVQHATQAELSGGLGPGYEALRSAAIDLGIEFLDDASALSEAVRRSPSPFQDNIHLNAVGQDVLARVLSQAVQSCTTRASP